MPQHPNIKITVKFQLIMDNSQPCKNCIDLAQKNVVQEIKIRELESQIRYYDNSNSPPSSNSIHWRKQKKERKSDSPSKPGQKDGA